MPLQTGPMYFNPPAKLDIGGSIRQGQINRLGQMAIEQAPERFAREKEAAGRESERFGRQKQQWKSEDLVGIRKIVTGHLGNLDTTDPKIFQEQARTILPQIAKDLALQYGDRARDDIMSLKVMADDLDDPEKLPDVMNMADFYKSKLLGPQKPVSELDKARTKKEEALAGKYEKYQPPKGKSESELITERIVAEARMKSAKAALMKAEKGVALKSADVEDLRTRLQDLNDKESGKGLLTFAKKLTADETAERKTIQKILKDYPQQFIGAQAQEEEITEEDIQLTMEEEGLTREEVLEALGIQ